MKIQAITPTRVSLFGGGTDIPAFSNLYTGKVISLAINIRQSITMYSEDDLYEVHGKNVFPYHANPEFYYKVLKEYGINDMHQTKLTCEFDGLIESGLGSSAAAAVALLGCINKRLNLGLNRQQIAEKAWELETDKLGLFGGKQDQYAATLGGANYFKFFKEGFVSFDILRPQIEPLLASLVLIHTGIIRSKPKIQESLKELSIEQIAYLTKLKRLVEIALEYLVDKDIEGMGKLMHESWEYKKMINPQVTSQEIDDIYLKGLACGAWGGKLLGSGGGGYMLFCVNPKKRQQFIKRLGYAEVDFSLDYNGLEVKVLND